MNPSREYSKSHGSIPFSRLTPAFNSSPAPRTCSTCPWLLSPDPPATQRRKRYKMFPASCGLLCLFVPVCSINSSRNSCSLTSKEKELTNAEDLSSTSTQNNLDFTSPAVVRVDRIGTVGTKNSRLF